MTINKAINGACCEAANKLQPPSTENCQTGIVVIGATIIPAIVPMTAPIAIEGVKVPPAAPERIVKTVTSPLIKPLKSNNRMKWLLVVLIAI